MQHRIQLRPNGGNKLTKHGGYRKRPLSRPALPFQQSQRPSVPGPNDCSVVPLQHNSGRLAEASSCASSLELSGWRRRGTLVSLSCTSYNIFASCCGLTLALGWVLLHCCTAALQRCVPIHSVVCTNRGWWKDKKEKEESRVAKMKERKKKKTKHKNCFVFLFSYYYENKQGRKENKGLIQNDCL